MNKKRSFGLTLFGLAEIIIAAIPTLLFILLVPAEIACFVNPDKGPTGCAIGFGMMILFLPSPFILWGGMGVMRLKPYGRKTNFIGAALIAVFPLWMLIARVKDLIGNTSTQRVEFNGYTIFLILLPLLVIFFILFYLNRSKVKEQFK